MRDLRGVFYILPGGGQRAGETLEETVRRECMEEVGISVEVRELLYVREYIGRNHDFSSNHKEFHQLEHVFRCEVKDPHLVCNGKQTDNFQVGVNWLALKGLDAIRFYPESLKTHFTDEGIHLPRVYLGDCN